MIDINLYRARIGQYNSKIYVKKMKPDNVPTSLNGVLLVLLLLVFITALLSLVILWFNTKLWISETVQSYRIEENGGPDIGVKLSLFMVNPLTWNAYMKAINGNIKNCMNISHWNGGSSHLGRSSKGKEKMEHVKFLLKKHNLDIMGLSEANLYNSVNEAEIRVDKYKIVHQ